MIYQLAAYDMVIRLADGAVIPKDLENVDRADYEAWLANGGVPDSMPSPPPPSMATYQAAIDTHVQATARARNYNDAASCAGYVASTVPSWAAEAQAFVAWRDQVYLDAFQALAAVQQGAEPPSIEALIASLPVLEWPG